MGLDLVPLDTGYRMEPRVILDNNGRADSGFEFRHAHIMKEEIERLEMMIAGCKKKLDNPNFIEKGKSFAVENERNKLSDAQLKLESMRRMGINAESKTVMVNGLMVPYLESFMVQDSTFYITSIQKSKD